MLISHFSKAKSNTRFSCCTTVTPVSRYRGQRFISEIRTESTLPTFYVTHSETCNLLLPCHAFRDMYPVLPCLGIRDIYHRPIKAFGKRSEYMSRIPRHVSSRVYVSHSETCKQPSVDLVHISECEIHGGP